MKASDLTVRGKPSPWKSECPTIFCAKKSDKGLMHLPCIYSTKKREYEKVEFGEMRTTLYPEQQVCLQEMLSKIDPEKACNAIFGHIYTGFGKSKLFTALAITVGVPILVLCNSDSVRTGWINEFQDSVGITPHVASGKTLGKYPITIASIQVCVKQKYGREQYSHYGVVICDEADVYCTQKSVNELLDMCPKLFIGCSATVIREGDGLDKVLDVFWGPRKNWVIRLKEFGETCSMELHLLHTPHKVEYIYDNRGKMDWGSMVEGATYIEEKNIFIRNLCILHSNKKILILCKTKSHVETLFEMLKSAGIDTCIYYDNLKMYYDAHVLIATVSKAGRGYDDKQVSSAYDGRRFDVLIMPTTMKNTDQALGRALRGNWLLCYLLVDDNPTMKKHAEAMKNANEKRGALIVEEFI